MFLGYQNMKRGKGRLVKNDFIEGRETNDLSILLTKKATQ